MEPAQNKLQHHFSLYPQDQSNNELQVAAIVAWIFIICELIHEFLSSMTSFLKAARPRAGVNNFHPMDHSHQCGYSSLPKCETAHTGHTTSFLLPWWITSILKTERRKQSLPCSCRSALSFQRTRRKSSRTRHTRRKGFFQLLGWPEIIRRISPRKGNWCNYWDTDRLCLMTMRNSPKKN